MIRGYVLGDRILQSTDSHSDWCAAHAAPGKFRLVGASAVGRSHLDEGKPRDDAFAARVAGDWLAVAVSDGVGSHPLSRFGSTYAVEVLCEQLIRLVTQTPVPAKSAAKVPEMEAARPQAAERREEAEGSVWKVKRAAPVVPVPNLPMAPPPARPEKIKVKIKELPENNPNCVDMAGRFQAEEADALSSHATLTWNVQYPAPSDRTAVREEEIRLAFQRTHDGMEAFAVSRGVELREYACTLLGMLVNTQTGAIAAGQIGDGLILGLNRHGEVIPLVNPPLPASVGEVYPFTRSDWERSFAARALDAELCDALTTLYLMTDGVAESCLHPPPEDILQRWAQDVDREMRRDEPLANTVTRLVHFLATFELRGNRDDRTLAVLLRS